jgi:hypothetical protein
MVKKRKFNLRGVEWFACICIDGHHACALSRMTENACAIAGSAVPVYRGGERNQQQQENAGECQKTAE